jgi:hypothetical protein
LSATFFQKEFRGQDLNSPRETHVNVLRVVVASNNCWANGQSSPHQVGAQSASSDVNTGLIDLPGCAPW